MINNDMPIGLGVSSNYIYQFLFKNWEILSPIYSALFHRLNTLKHFFLFLSWNRNKLDQSYTDLRFLKKIEYKLYKLLQKNNNQPKQYFVSIIYFNQSPSREYNKNLIKSLSHDINPITL